MGYENCSDRLLSDPEISVLKKGVNFAVTPNRVPVVEFISATESACRNLNISDANELKAKIVKVLCKHDRISDRNVSKEESKAINDLKEDEIMQIVHGDKGRVAVVLNKEDYTKKCQDLLNDSKTNTKLKKDPSAKYKNELISILKEMKKLGVISFELHKKLYPTCDQPPRFYGLPKLHKTTTTCLSDLL